jgi:hypothetical protein
MMKAVRTIGIAAAVMILAPVCGAAQSQLPTDTLLKGKTQLGFAVTPEVKLSRMNGEFAALAGCSFGLVMKPSFLFGVAGYGKITDIFTHGYMGYGGIILEYSMDPHRLVHYSIGGLLGAGNAAAAPSPFFVAEPQGRVNVNVAPWFRLGFGGGYRFIGGARCANSSLRGPTASITLMFGSLISNP